MRIRIPSLGEARVRLAQAGHAWAEQLGVQPRPPAGGIIASNPLVRPEPGRASALAGRWPAHRETVITAASRVLDGHYSLLGYSGLDLGAIPDWHADPVGGQRAPMQHWKRVPYLDATVVGDHKRTWELNRHDHLVLLGQAYALSRDTAFAARIEAHLQDWIIRNPPKLGINWVSSLELGFRCINWLWALDLAQDAISPDVRQRAIASLQQQVRHIERYLSLYFSPNTHLTGEALALLYAGVCLPDAPGATGWRVRGWELLEVELRRQFHADGVYFEQTSWYQRYCCDFYLHGTMLARAAGITPSAGWHDAVIRMCEVLLSISGPGGAFPLLGDDDGGALLPLSRDSLTSCTDSLALAAAVLDRDDFRAAVGAAPPLLGWIGAPARLAEWTDAAPVSPSASRMFAAGGWYAMRDGLGTLLLLKAGPHGALTGAHAHADALSVCLTTGAGAVITDPGTYTYMGPERDLFRSTAVHATAAVEARDSSTPAGPFRWADTAHCVVREAYASATIDYVDASHDGYERLARGMRHRRVVLWRKGDYIALIDEMQGHGPMAWGAGFPLAPGLSLSVKGNHARLFRGGHDVGGLHWAQGTVVTAHDMSCAPLYGQMMPIRHLQLAPLRSEVDTLLSVVVPGADDRDFQVSRCDAVGGTAWKITHGTWIDVIAVRKSEEVAVDGLVTTAQVLWARRSLATGALQEAMLGGGGHLMAGTQQWDSTATEWLAMPHLKSR